MDLRQLPAQRDFPIAAQCFTEFSECPPQAVRRLVEHDRHCLLRHFLQPVPAFLFIHGQKRFKNKPAGRQAGYRECCDARRRAGKRCHRDPGLAAHAHQFLAGVRYARRAGVRDQCHDRALLHFADKLTSLVVAVILMIGRHRRMDIEVIQQPDAVPRILRGDQIRIFQCLNHAGRHIPEVADRRRTKHQFSRHNFSSAITCHLRKWREYHLYTRPAFHRRSAASPPPAAPGRPGAPL